MPDSPEYFWNLDEIGTLREKSFRPAISLSARAFTLTAWFQTESRFGKQVIVRLNPPEAIGWNLALEDGRLIAECGTAEGTICRADGVPVLPGRWTFAAMLADAESRSLCLSDGQRTSEARIAVPDHAFQLHSVVVGGYTDPAGGHFDHTFGRNGTGLVDAIGLYRRVLTAETLARLSRVTGELPDVRITRTGEHGNAPIDLSFRADDSRNARNFVWDFGDGEGEVGQTVIHRFQHAGTYKVRLKAIGDGHRETIRESIVSLSGSRDQLERAPVFVNGSEGYVCYRVPSIVRATNRDLLVFAEGRRDSCSDSTPVIHIVSKRSRDNGQSWEPLQVVAQHGENALMNPSPVVDAMRGTGRIVLLYNLMTANEWALVRGEGRNRSLCITSVNHGETWSDPRDISGQIGDPTWRIQRPTLGHAIQRTDGRLIHASTITIGNASVFESQNVLIWSDDLGETWHHAKPCPTIGLNEATAAVLDEDCVLINSRAYKGGLPAGRRALTEARFAQDDSVIYGETTFNPVLVDSAVQASSLHLQTKRGPAILFANPAHPESRRQLTVRASFDRGARWPVAQVIDNGPSAYSDMVLQADGRVGVLYERGNQGGISYVSWPLDWLLGNQESNSEAVAEEE